MTGAAGEAYRRALAGWVACVRRAALAVVAVAVFASAALLSYSVRHLGVFTDTADLLSEELPFQQRYVDYKNAFPQFIDNIAIVLEGTNADVVQDAAATLVARLRERPETFGPVFDPESDPFFIRNGLLYMEVDELADLSVRLADAEPLLATLAEDMTLRGLFEVLGLAIDDVLDGATDPGSLIDIFAGVGDAVEARLEGRSFRLSWRKMMMGEALEAEDYRRVILVQPPLDYTTLRPGRAAMEAVRGLSAGLDPAEAGGLRVRLTGGAALDDEELASVSEGTGVAGALALILVGLLLVIGLGSWRLVAATLATLIMGLIWTAGFAALAIGHLNLISVTFVVLFIGLGVDFGIQYALRYREEVARGGDTGPALEAAASGVGGALTLAAAAAAIGFFSFVPTAYVGLSELGVIAGASMFIALFANLTVLPALLTLMPLPPPPAAGHPGDGDRPGPARPRARATAWLLRRPGAVTAGALALGVAALALAPEVRFDFNALNLSDQTRESVQTFRDLMREDAGVAYTASVLAGDLDEAVDLARRLEALDEVDKAVTLADFVPEDQDQKLDFIDEMNLFLFPVFEGGGANPPPDAAERRAALEAFRGRLDALLESPSAGALAPAARRLADGLGRLEAALEEAGPDGRDGAVRDLETSLLATLPARLEMLRRSLEAAEVTVEDLPPGFKARLVAADGRVLVKAVPAEDLGDNEALRRFVAAVRSVAPEATDTPVVLTEAGDAVIAAFGEAGAIALVGITLLLVIVLRSTTDTTLVLAPLALAAALTMAAAVLLGLSFNFANIIALPLLVGLGAAFGIHLVLRQRIEADVSGMLATSTPRAVLFSALTTMCSFGTLAISNHRGTASMGQLLAISLTLALACTLVVLPAMLELRARSGRAGKAAPDPGGEP